MKFLFKIRLISPSRTIFFLMVMDSVGQQLESGMVERDYFCSTISGFSSGKTSLAG